MTRGITVRLTSADVSGYSSQGAVQPRGKAPLFYWREFETSKGVFPAASLTFTATLVSGSASATVTVGSPTSADAGRLVTGTGIPTDTRIVSVSGATVTFTQAATASGSSAITSASVLADLSASVDHACTHGYTLTGLRELMGQDAPAFLYTDPTIPVVKLNYFEADQFSGSYGRRIFFPLPWDPNLRVHDLRQQAALRTWLLGNDTAGHPRWTHVYSVPVNRPTNGGSEMSLDYGPTGKAPVYSTPTALTSSITSTGLAITVDDPTGAPTGQGLLRVGLPAKDGFTGYELVQVTSRSGNTFTVAANGRGWGAPAASWPGGTQVQWAPTATATEKVAGIIGRPGALEAFDDGQGAGDRSGIWDYGRANYQVWESLGTTSTSRRALLLAAWEQAVDDMVDTLRGTTVLASLAGGGVFRDGWASAYSLATSRGTKHGQKLVCMVTNLLSAADPAGSGDYGYRYWASSVGHRFLTKALAAGTRVMVQTADPGRAGAALGMDEIRAIESALRDYLPDWIEVSPRAYSSTAPFTGSGHLPPSTSSDLPVLTTSAFGGWPAGSVTSTGYLLSADYNVQSRMVDDPGTPPPEPSDHWSCGLSITA